MAARNMEGPMQSLFDKLGSTATYVLGAIFFVVLLLVLLMVVRALLAGRVRAAGGRSRQPRLGVVDAFDLDRQRQLVLVRRDNVEHLIMIGGPNDVVVETAIVRAGELRSDARPRVGDDVPAAAPAPATVAPAAPVAAPLAPAAVPVPPSVPPAIPPSMPPLRSPSAAAAPVTPPPPPPMGTPPSPRIAPPGGPSRLATAPPRPPGAPLPPPVRPVGTPMGPGVRSGMSPPAPGSAEGEAGAPRRFEFGRTLSRANLEVPKPATPPVSDAPEVKPVESELDKIETKLESSDAPQIAPPTPEPEQKPAGEQPKQGDPLDALEEEMAKLLGRPPEKQ